MRTWNEANERNLIYAAITYFLLLLFEHGGVTFNFNFFTPASSFEGGGGGGGRGTDGDKETLRANPRKKKNEVGGGVGFFFCLETNKPILVNRTRKKTGEKRR